LSSGFSPPSPLGRLHSFDQRLRYDHEEFEDVVFRVDSVAAERLAATSAFLNAFFSAISGSEGCEVCESFLLSIRDVQIEIG
jgi:hypothetical protein